VESLSCGPEVSIQIRLKKWYLWPKTASEAISGCIPKISWWEDAPVPLAAMPPTGEWQQGQFVPGPQ